MKKIDEIMVDADTALFILEAISQIDSDDIDSDYIDIRFETESGDTGCDISIIEQFGKAHEIIKGLLNHYAELQKDNENLRAMMRELEIQRDKFDAMLTEAVQSLRETEKQRDGLVAENAALKDLQPTSEMIRAAHKETEEYDNINLDDDLVVFMWQAMHSKIKTPATDTAIAEIGAQAVEQAAMGFHEKCYAAFEGSDEYGLYIRAELMQVANKLRGGGCGK
ncbi:hypothetical protein [Pectobacterium odoriferum]|uniref:hypothetical protein n=1 Tax=Pectobacterium odoriferum TaxID=78398 RepID=UPI000CD1D597|nr:hypothetical protein [Pectobacterium odoriferum]POD92309.1 hypothetical protein BVY06_19510 [Pectobacterium odoriferum]POE39911.1 hypothetical protein BV920_11005 [Pectobacterium odoriferum]